MVKISSDPAGASRPPAPRSAELSIRSGLVLGDGATWWLRRVRFYADPALGRFRAYAHLERRDGDPMASGMNDHAGVELVGEGPTALAAAAHLVAELMTSPLLNRPEAEQ